MEDIPSVIEAGEDVAQELVAFADSAQRWWARYQLFNTLRIDSTLRDSSAVLDTFYQETCTTPMGELVELAETVVRLHPGDTTHAQAAAALDQVTPTNPIEEHLVDVLHIHLQTFSSGISRLTGPQDADLRAIAALCPPSDGPAVYHARSLLLMNDTLNIRWDSLCAVSNSSVLSAKMGDGAGEESVEEEIAPGLEEERSGIRVYPSILPAGEWLRVELPAESSGKLHLYSLQGTEVFDAPLHGGLNRLQPGNDLATGTYIYRVERQDGSNARGKLVIMR